jgi:hypothetical protein
MDTFEFVTTEFNKLKINEMMVLFIESDRLYVLKTEDGLYMVTYESGFYPKTFCNCRDFLATINEKILIVELPDGKMFVSS